MSETSIGDGQQPGDWTCDSVPHPHPYRCTECKQIISPDVWFFAQADRLLCVECATMVINAREDYIADLKNDLAAAQKGLLEAQSQILAKSARLGIATIALLKVHAYLVNGSLVMAKRVLVGYLKARGLIEKDGVTWTEGALELTGEDFKRPTQLPERKDIT